jgi:RNA polymerase sigma-70 factor (ECF subfamily)
VKPSALPWLYGVAANVLRHQKRSRHRHQRALDRLSHLPPRSEALVERQAQAAADAALVIDQIRTLPRREREVLVLSVWEGLSHAEIAVALDTTVGTVKSRLSRARARLDPDRLPRLDAVNPTAPPVLTLKEA